MEEVCFSNLWTMTHTARNVYYVTQGTHMHVYETEIKLSQNNCGGLPAKMSTNSLAGMHNAIP